MSASAATATATLLPQSPSIGLREQGRVPSHSHTGDSSSSHTHSNPHALERPQVYGGGRQGAKPYQEDSFFSWCSSTNRVIVGGIFDGHGGYNGLLASQTARDASLAFLQENAHECESWSVERWKTALTDLFTHLHNTIRASFIANFGAPSAPVPGHAFTNAKPPAEQRHIDARGIVRNAAGDPIHGGSTATLVVMVKDANGEGGANLITANVGDSTAFLVPTRGTWDFLSVDHGPENQDEWVRINTGKGGSAAASASSSSSGAVPPADAYPTKLMFVYDKTNVFRKYECPCVFLPDGTKDQQYVANPWGAGLHPTNVRYEPAVYAVTPRSVSKDSTCIAMCVEPNTLLRHMGTWNPADNSVGLFTDAPHFTRADDVHQFDVLYGEDGQPAVVTEEPIRSGIDEKAHAEVLYEVQQHGGETYAVTAKHDCYLEWRCNPTIANFSSGGLLYRKLHYYTPDLTKQSISVLLVDAARAEDETDAIPTCCESACWRAGVEECGTRSADKYFPPRNVALHFASEAEAKAAASVWVNQEAKLFRDSNGAQGKAQLISGRCGEYAGPLIPRKQGEARQSFVCEWTRQVRGASVQYSREFSWAPRASLPRVFISKDDADAYLAEQLAALPRRSYLLLGERFKLHADKLAARLPALASESQPQMPYGVRGGTDVQAPLSDVSAEWALPAVQMGVALPQLDAVLTACASLRLGAGGAVRSTEQLAGTFGLSEVAVCHTAAVVYDNTTASKWRVPQADDHIGGIVCLANPMCQTDMTKNADGSTTAPSFHHLSAVAAALPVDVRQRVLFQSMVPVCSPTGPLNVAEACWEPVTTRSLDFITAARVPWVVAASREVQDVFLRRCQPANGASHTAQLTPLGVEFYVMRWGNHTFKVFVAPHPVMHWARGDMYGAVMTAVADAISVAAAAVEGAKSEATAVEWNGFAPPGIGSAFHPLADLRPITACTQPSQSPRHWVGIGVDTPGHLYQLRDGTVTGNCRALGDFYAHQFGLTHVPSISVKRISCADSGSEDTTQAHTNSYATSEQAYTIFVASDGVWDCWKYDDLMQFINDELIQRHKNLLEMGEAVLEESISRAITNFGAKHYDDACLVVWQFTPTKSTNTQQHQQQQQQPLLQQQANGQVQQPAQSSEQNHQPDADMSH